MFAVHAAIAAQAQGIVAPPIKNLDHVQVRATPLPRAPARDPTWRQESFEYDYQVA